MAGDRPSRGGSNPGSPGGDEEMQVVDWDGGEDLDEEFRQGNCVEVEIDSEDDVPPPDEDDDCGDIGDGEEIGVIDPSQIYSDEETGPACDDALTSVSHEDSVLSVALCPTDRRSLLTGGQDDVAVLWTIQEGSGGVRCTEKCRLVGHTDSVTQVAFSHDGAYAATSSYDGSVRIWNPKSGALVHALEGPSKEVEWLLWHPKGHAILAGSTDTMAWMWWAPTGKVMQIFAGHAGGVSCGCWGLGGKVIVTGSEDKSLIVWNPRAGAPQLHIRQVHESNIISVCAHPESPIVVTGSEDAVAKAVQIETGKVLSTLSGHVDSVEAVAFSNPGIGGMLLLATGSMDGKVIVWDGKTFDMRCTLKEHVEQGGITRFKWLPPPQYGNWLCTCATDCTVRVFNALSGECVRTLRGHSDTVLDVDVALAEAEGLGPQLVVVSGSEDKTCRVFVVALWTGGSAQAGPSSVAAAAVANATVAQSPTVPAAASFAAAGSATTTSPGVPRDASLESPHSLPV